MEMKDAILVVEDDDADFELFHLVASQAVTEQFRPRYERVQSLAELADAVDRGSWSAVLVDLNLPDSYGLDTLRATLAQVGTVPVVVLTSVSDPKLGPRAVSLGAQDYLDKDQLTPEAIRKSLLFSIERCRLRRELDASRERAFEARMVSSVGKIAEGIAHEVNNSLMKITGLAEMHRGEFDEALAGDLGRIESEAGRVAQLVHKLLQAGGREDVARKEDDLSALVAGTVLYLQRSIPERIELATKLATGVHAVVNERQIHQLVEILVSNAVEAMPDGGKVKVVLSQTEDVCSLEVSDEGGGTGGRTLAELCEPFFTTKEAGHDGLGLSVVAGVVRQAGGDLSIGPSPEGGTLVSVHLPRVLPSDISDVLLEIEDTDFGLEAVEEDLGILIVDDEPVIRRILATHFSRAGLAVFEAGNGLEGLEMLELHGDVIGLVVSDVIMPEMRGTQMVEEIQKRYPGLPCIFMTATSKGGLASEESALSDGSIPIVHKPFSLKGLCDAIVGVLDRASSGK